MRTSILRTSFYRGRWGSERRSDLSKHAHTASQCWSQELNPGNGPHAPYCDGGGWIFPSHLSEDNMWQGRESMENIRPRAYPWWQCWWSICKNLVGGNSSISFGFQIFFAVRLFPPTNKKQIFHCFHKFLLISYYILGVKITAKNKKDSKKQMAELPLLPSTPHCVKKQI